MHERKACKLWNNAISSVRRLYGDSTLYVIIESIMHIDIYYDKIKIKIKIKIIFIFIYSMCCSCPTRCFPVTESPQELIEIFIFSKFFLVAHVASSQTKRLPHSFRKSDPSLRYFLVSAHQKHEFSKLDDFCRSSQNSTLKLK